jgi:serine/threonine-protein phosphatase 2A regulatory subunit B'
MNYFIKISYEHEENNGISEILEILCAVINGFAVPLKDIHIAFLERSLMPLHKVSNLAAFHQPLQNCIIQFVEKDPQICKTVIRYLLKVWPIVNAAKEVLFLQEIEELLETASSISLKDIYEDFFSRLAANCVTSNHF